MSSSPISFSYNPRGQHGNAVWLSHKAAVAAAMRTWLGYAAVNATLAITCVLVHNRLAGNKRLPNEPFGKGKTNWNGSQKGSG
jgi:hypothetical protein